MARTTIFFGLVLIVLGMVSYVGAAAVSVTALIPAFFGVALALLGLIGQYERYRKHALHLAAVVGLLGCLGTVPGLIGLVDMISGAEVERPRAVVAQSIMGILMAVFVGLSLRSFIGARRARSSSFG